LATVTEVEQILGELADRLASLDPATRAMLPARRTIEARCPDLGLVVHAEWRNGRIDVLGTPLNGRADIRISARSDDVVAIANGELTFGQAYATNRVRIDASITDLLRLRAVL
jgi:predicted lipid carrier protein YhbT